MSQTASLQVVQASFPLEVNGVANIKKNKTNIKKTINPLEVNANIKKINQDKYKKVLQASFPLEIKGIALLYQAPANRSGVNGKKIKIYLTMRKFQCIYPHLVL